MSEATVRWRTSAALAIVMALVVAMAPPAMGVGGGTGPVTTVAEHTDYGTGNESPPAKSKNWSIVGSGDSATLENLLAATWSNVSQSSVTDGDTINAHVDGGFEPTGPSASDEPEIQLTGVTKRPVHDLFAGLAADGTFNFINGQAGSGNQNSSLHFVPSEGGKLVNATVNITTGSNLGSMDVDVYIATGGEDGTYREGTLVKDDWTPGSTGTVTFSFDTAYEVTAGNDYEIEFVHDSGSSNEVAQMQYSNSGGNGIQSFAVSDSDAAGNLTLGLNQTTKDVGIDIDQDNTDEVTHSGYLPDGQTATYEIASLDTSDDNWDVSLTFGEVDIDAYIEERSLSLPANYTSASYDMSSAENGYVNVTTLKNASLTITWQYSNDGGNTWSDHASSTYTSTGVKSQSLSGQSAGLWRVQINGSYSGSGEPSIVIQNDSVDAQTYKPEVNESSASPNGTTVNNKQVTLSIDVTDRDFGKDHGDEVNVTFWNAGPDGSKGGGDDSIIASDILSSNGTASATFTAPSYGNVSWYVNATDDYGSSTETPLATFQTPSDLEIRSETVPSKLLDNVTVEIRFYSGTFTSNPLIFNRTTSNGVVNMTGLPTNRSFVVEAHADGFLSRRVYIEDLYTTQRVYLLNDTVNHTDVIFQMEDYTGTFPKDRTVLRVQKSINGTWQTIMGDYFGANGQFPAQLEYNVRHRLILINTQTGEKRILGPYTPFSDTKETVIVSPTGDINVTSRAAQFTVSPSTLRLPAESGVTIDTRVRNGTDSLANYSVTIYWDNGTKNLTLATLSGTNPNGERLSATINLSNRSDGVVRVIGRYNETDGDSGQILVAEYQIDDPANWPTLLDSIAAFVGLAPAQNQGALTTFLGMVITIALPLGLASVTDISTELVGLFGLGSLMVFGVIGWLSYDLVFVTLVGAGAIMYLGRRW